MTGTSVFITGIRFLAEEATGAGLLIVLLVVMGQERRENCGIGVRCGKRIFQKVQAQNSSLG